MFKSQTNLTQDQLLFADDQYDECEEHYPYTKFRELSRRLKQKFGISITPSKLRRDMMRYWVSIYNFYMFLFYNLNREFLKIITIKKLTKDPDLRWRTIEDN